MNYTLIIHSILRWAVLLFGLWTVLSAISGLLGRRRYNANDNRSNLLFMISCDIQLLLGLVLYFNGAWFDMVKANTREVMHNTSERFFAIEHASMMVLAWLLVHIGRSLVKRGNTDAQKHKRMLIWFGIALLIILAMIPWPFRPIGIRRELFPPL